MAQDVWRTTELKLEVAKQSWTYEDGIMRLTILFLQDAIVTFTVESIATPNQK
ncbi:MAG: hypothetical protein ACRD4V_03020 [Candidatus Acidiferrales bacterium]